MLQELSITFLFLGCLLAGWRGRDKRRKGKRFHLQIKELLREGTKFRKCKPQNCIPISIPPPSWKPGTTCVWGSGASAVSNKSPFSLESMFLRQRWEVSPFCLHPKYPSSGPYLPLRSSRRWSVETGTGAMAGPAGAAFRKPASRFFKKKKRVRKMQTWAAVKIWVFLSQPEVLSPHLS